MDSDALFIRNPADREPKGPFTLQQVADLVATGQVSAHTLVFDSSRQEWVAIESIPAIKHAVIPALPKLALKRPESARAGLNASAASKGEVPDRLAAAEGQTAATASRRKGPDSTARAIAVAHYGAIAGLLLAAAANLAPAHEAVTSLRASQLVLEPLAGLGLLDLVLGVVLALGVTSTHPLIRFRAAGGLGLAGFIYFAQGRSLELALVTCGCTGIFSCTVVLRMAPAILSAALSVGGMGVLAWSALISHQ